MYMSPPQMYVSGMAQHSDRSSLKHKVSVKFQGSFQLNYQSDNTSRIKIGREIVINMLLSCISANMDQICIHICIIKEFQHSGKTGSPTKSYQIKQTES